MFCSHCGKEINNMEFCPYCGIKNEFFSRMNNGNSNTINLSNNTCNNIKNDIVEEEKEIKIFTPLIIVSLVLSVLCFIIPIGYMKVSLFCVIGSLVGIVLAIFQLKTKSCYAVLAIMVNVGALLFAGAMTVANLII